MGPGSRGVGFLNHPVDAFLDVFGSTRGVEDLSTPIAELSEAYGEDGWCVYGALGGWIRECAVSRRTHNLSNFLDLSLALELAQIFRCLFVSAFAVMVLRHSMYAVYAYIGVVLGVNV